MFIVLHDVLQCNLCNIGLEYKVIIIINESFMTFLRVGAGTESMYF